MKIAHIESSINWGGQELRIIEQIQWLIANGHQTVLIARPESKILAQAQQRQLPFYSLDIRGSAKPKIIRQLCQFLRRERFDILDCHSNRDASYAAFAKWFTGQTVVRSRHISDPIKNSFLNKIVWRYGNDYLTTTAEKVNQRIIESKLIGKQGIYVQEAGVDEARFKPENRSQTTSVRASLQIPAHHTIVANVGMIRPDKGQLIFVEAAEKVLANYPDTTFIQVGEATDSTKDYFETIKQRLKNSSHAANIHFIGYREDIENYIALADIVVIASVGTEAKTRLVSQCFLSKTNIVATTTGGLPEMIDDHNTGLMCQPNNADSIADKLTLLFEQPELAAQLREQAYSHAKEKLTTTGMMKGLLNAYQQAIKSP